MAQIFPRWNRVADWLREAHLAHAADAEDVDDVVGSNARWSEGEDRL